MFVLRFYIFYQLLLFKELLLQLLIELLHLLLDYLKVLLLQLQRLGCLPRLELLGLQLTFKLGFDQLDLFIPLPLLSL